MSHLNGDVVEISDKPKRRYNKRKGSKPLHEDISNSKIQKRSVFTDPIEGYLQNNNERDIKITWPQVTGNQSAICKICGIHATRGVGKEKGIRKHIVLCHFKEFLYKCPYCSFGQLYDRKKVEDHISTEHGGNLHSIIINLDGFEKHVAEKAMECFGIHFTPQRSIENHKHRKLGIENCRNPPFGDTGQPFPNSFANASIAPQLNTPSYQTLHSMLDEFFIPNNESNCQSETYHRPESSHIPSPYINNCQNVSECRPQVYATENAHGNNIYQNSQVNSPSEDNLQIAGYQTEEQPGTSGLGNAIRASPEKHNQEKEVVSTDDGRVSIGSVSSQPTVCNDFIEFLEENDATPYEEIVDSRNGAQVEPAIEVAERVEPDSASSQVSISAYEEHGLSQPQSHQRYYTKNMTTVTPNDNRVAQSPNSVHIVGQVSCENDGLANYSSDLNQIYPQSESVQVVANNFPTPSQFYPLTATNSTVQQEYQERPILTQNVGNPNIYGFRGSVPSTPNNQCPQIFAQAQSSCSVPNQYQINDAMIVNNYQNSPRKMEYALPSQPAPRESPGTSGQVQITPSQQNLPLTQITPNAQAHGYINNLQTPMMNGLPQRPVLPNIVLPQQQLPRKQVYSPLTPNTPGVPVALPYDMAGTPNRFQFPTTGMSPNTNTQYPQGYGHPYPGQGFGTPMNYQMPQSPLTPNSPFDSPYPFPAFLEGMYPTRQPAYPQMNQNFGMQVPGISGYPNMNYVQANSYHPQQYPQNPMLFPPNSEGFRNPPSF